MYYVFFRIDYKHKSALSPLYHNTNYKQLTNKRLTLNSMPTQSPRCSNGTTPQSSGHITSLKTI